MLVGMISLPVVEQEIARGHGQRSLGEIFTPRLPRELLTSENFPHVHMDHPVDVSLRRMAQSKWNVLPVVSRSNVRELRGVVSLPDILRAYGVAEEARQEKVAAPEQLEASRRLFPGVVAAALALLILVGFLNYYYRSARGARAEQYFKTGTELAQQDRNAEAIEQFRNALSISPGSERYRLALGSTLVNMGRMSEGGVYLNEVLKLDPDNGAANLGLARIAASQGNKSDAVMYYHRAIDGTWPKDQEQNRLQARFELAGYLAQAGDKTQAVAELLAALGQKHRMHPPRSESDDCYWNMGHRDNQPMCSASLHVPAPGRGGLRQLGRGRACAGRLRGSSQRLRECNSLGSLGRSHSEATGIHQ